MCARVAVILYLINIEVAVRNLTDTTSFSNLNAMIEEITMVNIEIIEIVVDIHAVDADTLDMHVLDTVHRCRTPVSLHIYIMQM